jgi:hypothetical protein
MNSGGIAKEYPLNVVVWSGTIASGSVKFVLIIFGDTGYAVMSSERKDG